MPSLMGAGVPWQPAAGLRRLLHMSGISMGRWPALSRLSATLPPFLVSERRGSWGTAVQVPGLAALNTGGYAIVTAVSCAPSGWCAAVGDYADRASGEGRMFVISQR